MSNTNAIGAVQDVLDAAALLMLDLTAVTPGTPLSALKGRLDAVQKKLSCVFALTTMHPDITLDFEPGRIVQGADAAQMDQLEKSLEMSIPDVLPAELKVVLNDGRPTAGAIIRHLDGKVIDFVWNAETHRGTVDLSKLLWPLLEDIAADQEDVPGYYDQDEDPEAEPEGETRWAAYLRERETGAEA